MSHVATRVVTPDGSWGGLSSATSKATTGPRRATSASASRTCR
jgi:hypothetical protein